MLQCSICAEEITTGETIGSDPRAVSHSAKQPVLGKWRNKDVLDDGPSCRLCSHRFLISLAKCITWTLWMPFAKHMCLLWTGVSSLNPLMIDCGRSFWGWQGWAREDVLATDIGVCLKIGAPRAEGNVSVSTFVEHAAMLCSPQEFKSFWAIRNRLPLTHHLS